MKIWTSQQNYETFVQSANYEEQLNVESVIIRGNTSLARSVFNYVGQDTIVKYYIYILKM